MSSYFYEVGAMTYLSICLCLPASTVYSRHVQNNRSLNTLSEFLNISSGNNRWRIRYIGVSGESTAHGDVGRAVSGCFCFQAFLQLFNCSISLSPSFHHSIPLNHFITLPQDTLIENEISETAMRFLSSVCFFIKRQWYYYM